MNLVECPFCGSETVYVYDFKDEYSDVWWKAHCSNCHVETNGFASREEAEVAWNRRINYDGIEPPPLSYEKKLMRELCEEMGIRWVEETGFPRLNGRELTPEELVDMSFTEEEINELIAEQER